MVQCTAVLRGILFNSLQKRSSDPSSWKNRLLSRYLYRSSKFFNRNQRHCKAIYSKVKLFPLVMWRAEYIWVYLCATRGRWFIFNNQAFTTDVWCNLYLTRGIFKPCVHSCIFNNLKHFYSQGQEKNAAVILPVSSSSECILTPWALTHLLVLLKIYFLNF